MNDLKILDKVNSLEESMNNLPDDVKIQCLVSNEFCQDLYARTIYMYAGLAIVSREHLHDSFAFVRQGSFDVTTDAGIVRYNAGDMFVTYAGAKRALYIIEDTILTTVHSNPANITDENEIINEFTKNKEIMP